MVRSLTRNQLLSQVVREGIVGAVVFLGGYFIYSDFLKISVSDLVVGVFSGITLGIVLSYIANVTSFGQRVQNYAEDHWWRKLLGGVVGGVAVVALIGGILVVAGGSPTGAYYYVASLAAWASYLATTVSLYFGLS